MSRPNESSKITFRTGMSTEHCKHAKDTSMSKMLAWNSKLNSVCMIFFLRFLLPKRYSLLNVTYMNKERLCDRCAFKTYESESIQYISSGVFFVCFTKHHCAQIKKLVFIFITKSIHAFRSVLLNLSLLLPFFLLCSWFSIPNRKLNAHTAVWVCVCVCNVHMLNNSYAYTSREQSCDDHTSAYECAYKIISNFKFAMKNYTNIGSDRIIWYESQLTIQAIC